MSSQVIHAVRFGEQAAGVLLAQWEEFCRLRTVVLGGHDPDSIHDLRVASRRIRATLALFTPFIPAKTVKSLSKKIRQVTRELGHVRNIDEAIIYFNTLPVGLPCLAKQLRRARKQEIKAVFKVLKRFPGRDMERIIRKAVAKLGGSLSHGRIDEELPVHLSETSIQRYQVLHSLLAPAVIPENMAERHELRIAIKKWRYLLETIGQVCRQDYTATLEVLKGYQGVLGNLNDMVEFGALSAKLSLPPEEAQVINSALARDSAGYLASFVRIAAHQPLQYTFHL
jgi:CHAD domain-containing protein